MLWPGPSPKACGGLGGRDEEGSACRRGGTSQSGLGHAPPPPAAAVGWSGLGDRPASSQAWGLVCPGESPSALGLCPLYVGWGWLYQVASQSVPGLWTVAGPGGEAMETSLTSVLLSREAVTLGRVCPGCCNCCPSTRSPSHTADGSWAVCTVVLRGEVATPAPRALAVRCPHTTWCP